MRRVPPEGGARDEGGGGNVWGDYGMEGRMGAFPRYAIYFTPARDSALYRYGAGLLGYDAFGGVDCAFPEAVTRLAPDWAELTAKPRRYGFHATLKAPFALAPGTSEADLMAACESFAREPRPLPVIAPVVRSLASFIAIVPAHPCAALPRFADACVAHFERFRAPPSPGDRARRGAAALTPRQARYLARWGYPYVMEEFRFHMTLTGCVPLPRHDALRALLQARLEACEPGPVAIDAFAVLRQDDAGVRFRVVRRYGAASQPPEG